MSKPVHAATFADPHHWILCRARVVGQVLTMDPARVTCPGCKRMAGACKKARHFEHAW